MLFQSFNTTILRDLFAYTVKCVNIDKNWMLANRQEVGELKFTTNVIIQYDQMFLLVVSHVPCNDNNYNNDNNDFLRTNNRTLSFWSAIYTFLVRTFWLKHFTVAVTTLYTSAEFSLLLFCISFQLMTL